MWRNTNTSPSSSFFPDSPWDHRALLDRVARDAGELLGGADSALLIDESGFAKKGDKSAGVARQWNGRLGKVDNCQVGVFAALSDGRGSALIEGRLYLPECWSEDPQRCRQAKIPESEQQFRSKPELALEMIRRAEDLGLEFGWVRFDALYGSTPWLLREIEDMGRIFVGDVRSNFPVYEEDPRPYVPRRRGGRGRRFVKRRARTESRPVAEVFVEDPDLQWEEIAIREGTKGTLRVSACRKRVWLWDGQEERPRCWWAVCTHDDATGETKFFFSNASEAISLGELVRRHAVRYWVERGFQDAKSSLGMADYQARGWVAWHHHMGDAGHAVPAPGAKSAHGGSGNAECPRHRRTARHLSAPPGSDPRRGRQKHRAPPPEATRGDRIGPAKRRTKTRGV